jgi:hypothetical protein
MCRYRQSAICSALFLSRLFLGHLCLGTSTRRRTTSRRIRSRIYRHPLTILAEVFKGNHAVNFGEQCVITSATDIGSRMNFCAELTNNNAARCHALPAEALYSAPLSSTVATVPRTTARLFMCHEFSLDKINKKINGQNACKRHQTVSYMIS